MNFSAQTVGNPSGFNRSRDEHRELATARAVLHGLPTPVLVVLPSGTIALCNDAAGELLGMQPEALEGSSVESVLAPIEMLARATTEGTRAEVPYERPDGILIRLSMRCAPCTSWSPRSSTVVALTAVTERARVEVCDPTGSDTLDLVRLAVRTRRPLSLDVEVDGARRKVLVVADGAAVQGERFDGLGDCFG